MARTLTIDGPAGTGKSTVSRLVAQRLGIPHLDTGAYYRAATLVAMRSEVDLQDEREVGPAVARAFFDQIEGAMYVDGEDVSLLIRDPEVNRHVSVVAAFPSVRRTLVEHQRNWVEMQEGGAIVEGRDIGSVVFPSAPLKIYLDASAEVRAKRRAIETGQEPNRVLEEQGRRDHLDSTRADSPLAVPEGAVVIDTDSLTIEQVVEEIVRRAYEASF